MQELLESRTFVSFGWLWHDYNHKTVVNTISHDLLADLSNVLVPILLFTYKASASLF